MIRLLFLGLSGPQIRYGKADFAGYIVVLALGIDTATCGGAANPIIDVGFMIDAKKTRPNDG